ncbi:MAG TPA: carbamate kinase [Desulfuromonadales bacterium]|nr:carbamate kinase [Desulfuromonadales bacterium]
MRRKPPIAVVALGGNALIRQGEKGEVEEQLRHIRESVLHLPLLLAKGYALVITHGNGPVVGQLLLQNEAARETVPSMPLDVCDADSEGSIGYLTQQTLVNVLRGQHGKRPVVSLITQVVVDPADPAFTRPTKPVGPFYTEAEAERQRRTKGWTVVADAGRGFRRVVPSPRPLQVVEEEPIRILLEHGVVVIAAGGGGVPVRQADTGELLGVEAVIDKDRASALLANGLGARLLVILTAVDFVYRSFGRPDQEPLPRMDVTMARRLLAEGEFAPGSMGPKIEAAIEFLEGGGEEVLITLPENLADALDGKTGTRIVA